MYKLMVRFFCWVVHRIKDEDEPRFVCAFNGRRSVPEPRFRMLRPERTTQENWSAGWHGEYLAWISTVGRNTVLRNSSAIGADESCSDRVDVELLAGIRRNHVETQTQPRARDARISQQEKRTDDNLHVVKTRLEKYTKENGF